MNAAYLTQLKRFTYKKLQSFSEEEKEDVMQEAFVLGLEKNAAHNPSFMTNTVGYKSMEAKRDEALWRKQESLIRWYFVDKLNPNIGYMMDYKDALDYLQDFSDRNLVGTTKLVFDRVFLNQELAVDLAKELKKTPGCIRAFMDLGIKKCIRTSKGLLYSQMIKDLRQGKYCQ